MVTKIGDIMQYHDSYFTQDITTSRKYYNINTTGEDLIETWGNND